MVLNDGQYKIYKEALEWFKSPSSEQVFEIDGLAGTGKSVLIAEILKGLNLRHDQYMPMAYTGQASIVMRSKGFPNARSIHSSLYEVVETLDRDDINSVFGKPKKKKMFRKKLFLEPQIKLFFIDEAYMVPDFMVRDILSFGIKVIVCGDAHQLPPIGGRPAFLTKPTTHHLTQLMRQSEDDPIIYLANRAINGRPIHCGSYGDSVMVISDRDFFPQMLGYADVVITGTNRIREMFNQFVRYYKGYTSIYPYFGERLICRDNNWNRQREGIALANGLTGYCIKPAEMVENKKPVFKIDFKPDMITSVFDNIEINKEYFTAPLDKRLEFKDSFEARQFLQGELFEYAYAITTHLSQGGEYDKGIYVEEFLKPQIQKQLLYTGITRFKKSLIILKKNSSKFDLQNYI